MKKSEEKILTGICRRAQTGSPEGMDSQTATAIDTLVGHCETNKGVLSVFLTLALKKAMDPKQDIRNHQAGMPDGFSARGLDSKFVTPFLRKENFPHMVSGAGALTRSLEQAMPYDRNYPGKIRPAAVRDAFLTCVERVQNGGCDAHSAMQYLLRGLIAHRDRDKNLKLIKPKNRSIAVVSERIGRHFELAGSGGARLPALAIYAVYKQMMREIRKYKTCRLCPLQPHTSADRRSGFLGDIQVNDDNDKPMEAVEVKHGVKLTPELTEACCEKIKTAPGMRTYYLLSTNEQIDRAAAVSDIVMRVHRNHGCQIIVNGIQSTLRYYLRLLSSPDNFLDDYVGLVEKESSYEIKMLWQELWEENS